MCREAVTPYGRDGPSSRVRVFGWLDRTPGQWRVHAYVGHGNARPRHLIGHPVAVTDAERSLRALARGRPRHLLLHREASPLSRGGLEVDLLRSAQFAVYDFDDALQHDHGGPGHLRRLAPKSRKALVAVRHADRVIAGNAYLADWASEHNADVHVIPSCVSLKDYQPKDEHDVHDPPRLGWIGTPGEEKQLLLIRPALEELHRRTGAELVIIGDERRRLGPLEDLVRRHRWSSDAQRILLRQLDIGLMPVEDAPYERGKCGYKLLQYAATGLCSIASPVGVNEEIQRRTGMATAAALSDWVDGVTEILAATTATRASRGAAAREAVGRHYSYSAWLEQWTRMVETR